MLCRVYRTPHKNASVVPTPVIIVTAFAVFVVVVIVLAIAFEGLRKVSCANSEVDLQRSHRQGRSKKARVHVV